MLCELCSKGVKKYDFLSPLVFSVRLNLLLEIVCNARRNNSVVKGVQQLFKSCLTPYLCKN